MRIVFFDTETTGIGELDRLCQLAVKERGVSEPLHNSIYKPPIPIPPGATAIHKISNEMAASAPCFTLCEDFAMLKDYFENSETLAVAHNAGFDVAMLGREGITPARVICTHKVARALDPARALPKYNLQYLREVLQLEVEEAVAHSALGDVLVLEALFERLLAKLVASEGSEEAALEKMVSLTSEPMLFTTMRFGKHKGRKLEDIAKTDSGYLEWLLAEKRKTPTTETDWIYTLEHYLAKRA
jgi:exodeoxyribonuclease X